MASKESDKVFQHYLKPFVNNSSSLQIVNNLERFPSLSLAELKTLSGLNPNELRCQLVYLTKQNLICFEKQETGIWHLSLNKSFLKELVYLPLYLEYVNRKYSEIEKEIIMNLLLNSSKSHCFAAFGA